MKKLLTFLIFLLMTTNCLANIQETPQVTAQLVNSADSNDAALDVNETSWAATSTWAEISSIGYTYKIKFYVYDTNASGPNDVTFSYQYYVADYYCNAEIVAEGTATCGAAQLSHNPVSGAQLNSGDPNSSYCWVDTLGTPTEDWASGHFTTQNDDGGNSVATILVNRQSGKKHWCRIYNRSRSTMTVYCVAYYY